MRRQVEHTADVALEVEADDLAAAFAEAALALGEVVTGGGLPEPREAVCVTLKADDVESLLVRWLAELLVRFDAEGFLAGAAEVALTPPTRDARPEVVVVVVDGRAAEAAAGAAGEGAWRLRATLRGEAYDPARHGYGSEVKAISYHTLRVAPGPPARLRVLLDL